MTYILEITLKANSNEWLQKRTLNQLRNVAKFHSENAGGTATVTKRGLVYTVKVKSDTDAMVKIVDSLKRKMTKRTQKMVLV